MALATSVRKGPTERDEAGNLRCRKCHGFVQWGEVILIEDRQTPKGRRPDKSKGEQRWVLLDMDYMPHGCRKRA